MLARKVLGPWFHLEGEASQAPGRRHPSLSHPIFVCPATRGEFSGSSLNQVLASRAIENHTLLNYPHKSLNHQNPVMGSLWKGKSGSLKHLKLKSQKGFSTSASRPNDASTYSQVLAFGAVKRHRTNAGQKRAIKSS